MSYRSILNPPQVQHMITKWLREDVSSFDFGAFLFGEEHSTFVIWMKEKGSLAGVPFANAVFDVMGCKYEWFVPEGAHVEDVPMKVASITGLTREMLRCERLVLNILARASGIATAAARMYKIGNDCNWKGHLAGTRRTTPGFRLVEKYAMIIGGADPHRFDLSSMIMLRDNEILAAGSLPKAVERARRVAGFSVKVEVQCRDKKEAEEAVKAGADIVRLYELTPKEISEISAVLKELSPTILVDASCAITEENLHEYALPNVDIISCMTLCQGYSTIDLSMKIVPGSTYLPE